MKLIKIIKKTLVGMVATFIFTILFLMLFNYFHDHFETFKKIVWSIVGVIVFWGIVCVFYSIGSAVYDMFDDEPYKLFDKDGDLK